MSHFTTINTQIKDIEALRLACAEMGLQIEANAEARGYRSNRLRGDYVIRLRGPYDVALCRESTGGYSIHADLWNGHVEAELGQGFGTLKQLYGVHKATTEARRKGLNVRRRQLANGTVRLALCQV